MSRLIGGARRVLRHHKRAKIVKHRMKRGHGMSGGAFKMKRSTAKKAIALAGILGLAAAAAAARRHGMPRQRLFAGPGRAPRPVSFGSRPGGVAHSML